MSSVDFYKNLQSFHKFSMITDDAQFVSVPDDWKVIVADISGSTIAIETGRYKDVNTLGAAAIVAVQKGLGKIEFPYVFGGDGASMLVPSEKFDLVAAELLALKSLSELQFGLGMRVGAVEMSELKNEGADVSVAKFELVAGRSIAVFKGGGLSLAEKKIKGQEDVYSIRSDQIKAVDLQGLSCRWNPIENQKGRILSLLVQARGNNPSATYRDVLLRFDEIFEGKLEEANPVDTDNATYRSFGDSYRNEMRFHQSLFTPSFLFRCLEILAAVLVFRFKIPPFIFNPKRYQRSMRAHSDYRKFDDMLRMIVDCSADQASEIHSFMQNQFDSGNVFYGIHESSDCLMTCYVHDLNDGNHIHFIDGGDGGYAMAAKQMKAQMKDIEFGA